MFIATKYEEIYPIRLSTLYERIAHKKLSMEDIKAKEIEILEALEFNVTTFTSLDFLNMILLKVNIH